MRARIIAITLGDINGIGPEVALKSLHGTRWPAGLRFVLVGSHHAIRTQAEALKLPVPAPWAPDQGPPSRKVVSWDPTPGARLKWTPGRMVPAASLAAAQWIRETVQLCVSRRFDAMVTAPICKEGFHKAGVDVPGHTEMLAALTGTRSFAMMLLGGPLRVVLVTRHIPLARVPHAVTRKAIVEALQLTAQSLPWLGCRRGRIAVCGLNPHAGEGGDIGKEDIQTVAPAIASQRKAGLRVSGPHPADTVFHQAAHGAYDAVVAMYHDQGLGPLKTVAFDSGVNLTLGLPMVRTSPDHGTAFGLAGKNSANPSSMREAIKLAAYLAGKRNPWRGGSAHV
jgi:4-hydroxythreonine-4-phosphate dehydrogenase